MCATQVWGGLGMSCSIIFWVISLTLAEVGARTAACRPQDSSSPVLYSTPSTGMTRMVYIHYANFNSHYYAHKVRNLIHQTISQTSISTTPIHNTTSNCITVILFSKFQEEMEDLLLESVLATLQLLWRATMTKETLFFTLKWVIFFKFFFI